MCLTTASLLAAAPLPAWLGANLLHALWLSLRRSRWERRLRRGPDGLLPDAAPFSLGAGADALLLIHGFADTPRIWQRFAARLAAAGPLTCRAMRLPGSAEPPGRAARPTLDLWRQAVDRELDALRASHRAVWVGGHSLGAALAFDAALRRPADVAGLAALAPLVDVSPRRAPLLPPALWFRLAQVALALSPTFESCFSATATAADDPAFSYTRDRFVPFAAYRALFALVRANRDRAQDLRPPLFAAVAGADSVVDAPAALRWLARVPGVRDIRLLPEAPHVLPLEPGWQELADRLAAFMRQQRL